MSPVSTSTAAPISPDRGPAPAARALWTLKRWSAPVAFSVADQALASGAHFGVSLLLARWLSPAEYGVFALVYAVFLFGAGIHNAVILEPMGAIGPAHYADCLGTYLGAVLWLHAGTCLVISAPLLAGAAALAAWASPLWPPLLAMAVAAPGMLLFWLARRACYLGSRPERAMLASLCYALLLAAGTGWLWRTGRISAGGIFLLMSGAGLAVSVGVGNRLSVRPAKALRIGDGAFLRQAAQRHWGYARWSLGTTMLYWLANSLYLPLVGGLAGLKAVAAYRATDNLLLPMSQALTGAGHLLLPRLSRRHALGGKAQLRAAAVKIGLAASSAAGLYVAGILAFGTGLMRLAYGSDAYSAYFCMAPYLGAAVIIRALGDTGLGMALRAAGRPEAGFWATCAGTAVTLTAGLAMVWRFGAAGAAAGWMTSSAAVCLAYVSLFRRWMR
ncbi:MAG: hypothetical protein IT159_16170 [Bryobacterales bacterium]|nr:hypothetical protein [Bryobacterales bacterium]